MIGHQKQRQLLKVLSESSRIPHGLLFSGQDQLGKKTLAIEFIKYLNCLSKKKPCQTCRSCQDIDKNNHPDFILIEPDGKEIKISQIRDLIWKLSLYSYSAPFKTAIIDNAHLMSREAQNCLLKTLEEPKGKTLLVLTSSQDSRLMSTILSRVQRIKFFPVKKQEIEKYLIGQKVSKHNAEYFASLSCGRPGIALSFLNDEKKLQKHEKIIADLDKINGSELAFRFQYAKDLLQDISNIEIMEILDIWLRYFKRSFDNSIVNNDSESLFKLKKTISNIENTSHLISSFNINPKLAFEILLMEI